jgi:predicted phosphodiesterase
VRWLITSDLHFSDRPKDSSRFGLLPWLAKQQELHQTEATFLLGDLTQEKDNHSSTLVNRITDELAHLRPPIFIVRGNHDCIDPSQPFFRFLNSFSGIKFYSSGCTLSNGVRLVAHCRTQAEFNSRLQPANYLMCHQTFEGAIAETGQPMSGFSQSAIEKLKYKGVWSGDVHRPQTVNCVTYTGSPYCVRFGDDFIPRVLLVTDGRSQDLHFPSPRKWSLTIAEINDLADFNLKPGDQVKITVSLPREQLPDWLKHRRAILSVCKEIGVEVFGVELTTKSVNLPRLQANSSRTPTQLVLSFCKAEKTPRVIRETGLALVEDDTL